MSSGRYSCINQQRGVSLVELMVAAVIGMVSILVLMQVGISFEDQKRTTVGGAGSVDSSAVVLSQLRRDLSVAGSGLNNEDAIGCSNLTVYRESNGSKLVTAVHPVDITQGANDASDTLDIRYGDIRRYVETALFSMHDGGTGPFVTDSNYGFIKGDVFLAVEADIPPSCALAEVSGLAANDSDVLHQAGGTRFNNPAGTGVVFVNEDNKGRLINLGQNPSFLRYSVSNGILTREEQLSRTSADILEDVMTFQAQYGFNTPDGLKWSDTVLDANANGVLGDSGDWLNLTAVRVAVVIRQDKMDRPDSNGKCEASLPTIDWSFGSYSLTGVPNGRCYRYRVGETVVPIRNLIWGVPPAVTP